ncbi:unnamed protein product [Hyaloperonospora brassicae]|uniref:Asparagine synthetase domain-containing protein n=1 Tax=Hyaloperonospora brassicae TaxID=162125 RepID=A0AAV0TSE7_HYABA|nr:unnamed protein product [Hyaloperonospora brassicae]
MCGIAFVLTALLESPPTCANASRASPSSNQKSRRDVQTQCESSHVDHDLESRLRERGPDQYHCHLRHMGSSSKHNRCFTLAMHSAVLHLRGPQIIRQPVVDDDDNVLCWNGEVFGMGGRERSAARECNINDDDTSDDELMHLSDTMMLSERLQLAARQQVAGATSTTGVTDPVVEVLRQVHGPFAIVWLHATTKRVYFAHDRFGRRSLLYKRWARDQREDMIVELAKTTTTASTTCSETDLTRFVLTNVAIGHDNSDLMQYRELPASGIYVLDLHEDQALTATTTPSYRMEFHPYAPIAPMLALAVSAMKTSTDVSDRFGCQLPRIATTPDITKTLEAAAQALLVALSNAVGLRVRSVPSRAFRGSNDATARAAVFFSGGLDSVVLAALTHLHAPATEPVDLLTVCFDEKSSFASPDRRAAELAHAELCKLFPQRQWNLVKINVSREELASKQCEIQTLMAPCDTHMDFNIGAAFWFLSRGRGVLTEVTPAEEQSASKTINVRRIDSCGHIHNTLRSTRVNTDLPLDRCVNPATTAPQQEQDDTSKSVPERSPVSSHKHCSEHTDPRTMSISMSAPIQTGSTSSVSSHYQTSARVVLVGIGADEQLAGYGRHRTTLVHGGAQALRAELKKDLSRLWTRNLGRDDRCIAAHGREARFPYLDESVVATIASFPISCLCDADLPRGVGDKRVLRVVAQALGLKSCAELAKRAIQFGSRIAKVSHTGSNRQTQGDSKFISMRES